MGRQPPLGGRLNTEAVRSRAQIHALVLVASTGLVCGALGAGIARLVAGPSAAEKVASAGPPVSVPASSAYLGMADLAAARQDATQPDSAISRETTASARRAGTGKKSPGKSGRPPATDEGRATTGASAAPKPATWGEPSQPEQGGSSKPPAGSSPGTPADGEEPSEEGPGDGDDEEEDDDDEDDDDEEPDDDSGEEDDD